MSPSSKLLPELLHTRLIDAQSQHTITYTCHVLRPSLLPRSARLDQAVSRLNRVISAFEMEQARPSPRTVEKVLARASCGAAGQDDTAAEGDKEVAATRRRLANDLMAAANAIR